jgi:PAS domain S-box-containing protein
MQVLVFFYQYTANKNINGPGWWLMWSAAESLGFILILLRNIPSLLHIVIVFQNPLILAGTIFIYLGVMRFFNKEINLKFLISFFSVYLVVHFYFILIQDNIVIRSIIFSAGISIISFLTAISIYRNKTRPVYLTANLNVGIFILHGIIFSYRTVVLISSAPVTDMFAPTLFNIIPYADALIVSLLWTFGFIIMLNQKLTSEISESKSRFELIFNTSPDAALISRLDDGLIIDFNQSFTRIAGYTKKDITGSSTLDLQIWKNQAERAEFIRHLNEKGYCENLEVLFQRKGGVEFTGLISANIIILGGFPHILSVTRDITDRKKADEEIRDKNEELKRINIEKDKLFSVIAHDLRSPLTAFMGLSEMMLEELPSMSIQELQSIVGNMKKSSGNLYGLLENLLEWAKVEQGLVRFNPESTPLLPLVNESLSRVIESARTKNIDISFNIPAELMIYADKNVFHTIIRNLVSNAIKFTDRGGKIMISSILTENHKVEISIKDSGIGMNLAIINNLFKLDTQVNREGTKGEPSTGLGLILCKGFIEKHGGEIWVESEEGIGSVFHFTIPSPV